MTLSKLLSQQMCSNVSEGFLYSLRTENHDHLFIFGGLIQFCCELQSYLEPDKPVGNKQTHGQVPEINFALPDEYSTFAFEPKYHSVFSLSQTIVRIINYVRNHSYVRFSPFPLLRMKDHRKIETLHVLNPLHLCLHVIITSSYNKYIILERLKDLVRSFCRVGFFSAIFSWRRSMSNTNPSLGVIRGIGSEATRHAAPFFTNLCNNRPCQMLHGDQRRLGPRGDSMLHLVRGSDKTFGEPEGQLASFVWEFSGVNLSESEAEIPFWLRGAWQMLSATDRLSHDIWLLSLMKAAKQAVKLSTSFRGSKRNIFIPSK